MQQSARRSAHREHDTKIWRLLDGGEVPSGTLPANGETTQRHLPSRPPPPPLPEVRHPYRGRTKVLDQGRQAGRALPTATGARGKERPMGGRLCLAKDDGWKPLRVEEGWQVGRG